jgi:hypothetical protein
MAVLVHLTFVDDTELGNGVATLRVSGPSTSQATIVMQPGAVEVTNPEDDGLPEIVEVFSFGSSSFATLRQSTERLPLGATVLEMPAEYIELTNLLRAVGDAFGTFHGETQYDIEFEFKKIVGEGLVLRQVRRIPGISSATDTPPVLIRAPASLCTFQGEYADVFANHRLKTRWELELASGPVEAEGDPWVAANHRYVLESAVEELTGHPATWPQAQHESFDPQIEGVFGRRDSWSIGSGVTRRVMTLSTLIPTSIGPNRLPIVFPDDLGFTLDGVYDTPVAYLDFDRAVSARTEEQVLLVPCHDLHPLTAGHLLQVRTPTRGDVSLEIGFYWPPFPTGAVAGYTAPLDRWIGTTIAGIGAQPTFLDGFFSQTYRPEHHNFTENFIFDPHLEEGIDLGVLQQWDQAGIQALVVPADFDEPPFMALTAEGQLVNLEAVGF